MEEGKPGGRAAAGGGRGSGKDPRAPAPWHRSAVMTSGGKVLIWGAKFGWQVECWGEKAARGEGPCAQGVSVLPCALWPPMPVCGVKRLARARDAWPRHF